MVTREIFYIYMYIHIITCYKNIYVKAMDLLLLTIDILNINRCINLVKFF